MFERRKRTHRISALRCFCVIVFVLLFLMLSCCNYYVSDKIENYEEFLSSYKKFGQDTPVEPTETPKKIIGFTPITNKLFDFGKTFNGYTTFVKLDNKNYILNKSGQIEEISQDLRDIDIIYDKYIIKDNSKKGLMNVYGKQILPVIYDNIEIVGNSVLAVNNSYVETYINNSLTAKSQTDENVNLLNENLVLFNSKICGLDFKEKTVCGYNYITIPNENKVVVDLKNGFVGYADIVSEELMEGNYLQANNFHENVAVAITQTGESIVINEKGQILYKSKTKIIGDRYEGYHCYITHNTYGVLNNEFQEITGAIFKDISYEHSVGNRLIVRYGDQEKLFSLYKLEYEKEAYDKIEYNNDLYFCKKDNVMLLFDSELNLLAECDDAQFADGILTIEYNGKYAYYKKGE